MRNWLRSAANKFKEWNRRRLVHRHFGTTYPDSVQLTNSPHRIYLDPHDPRAYKILLAGPLKGKIPRNQPFWNQGCTRLAPSLVLDVGVNFGECLFAPVYAATTEIHGFDANPALTPYHEKSRALHPDGQRMQIHFGLLAEKPGPPATFYVDRQWSGNSTAVAGNRKDDADRYEQLSVPVTSVDTVLGERPRQFGSVFFKIDVEGYEYRVLQGMQQVLANSTWSVGLLEFEPHLHRVAGDNLSDYWNFLTSRFQVYAFDPGAKSDKGVKAKLITGDWEQVKDRMDRPKLHTDLIVVGGNVPAAVDEFLSSYIDRS